jgi:hypothetical protein
MPMESLEANWRIVERGRSGVVLLSASPTVTFTMPTPWDFANSLALVYAYAVLGNALETLRDKGWFRCNTWMLGPLMKESHSAKSKLAWRDFGLVWEGKDKRDDVAHKADLPSREVCWKYIDAVKAELVAWGFLPGE